MFGKSTTAALVLGLVLGACEEPFAFDDTRAAVAGTYDLSQANGHDLPYLLAATSCDVIVTGGTLVLQLDGTYVLDVLHVIDCARSGGQRADGRWAFAGTYTRLGTTLWFERVDQLRGTLRWTGSLTPDGLALSPITVPAPFPGSALTASFRRAA